MKRTMWAGIALWCVTVASAVGIGWVAIELVGDDVGPAATTPLTTPSAVVSVSPGTSPTPSAKPTKRPTATATARPSATATRPATVAPTPRTTTAAPSRQIVKTWSGTAGSVRVSCTGSTIKLLGATPADGWRVERAEAGSDVDVRFERGEDEVEVEARCGPSGPVFSVESES